MAEFKTCFHLQDKRIGDFYKPSIIIVLLAFLIPLSSCNTYEDPYAPVLEKFSETDVERIFLDQKDIVTVNPSDFTLIENPDSSAIEKGMKWATPSGDNLIGVSRDEQSIRAMDRNTGKITLEVDFSGRGPGEYQTILQLSKTESGFLLMDGLSKFIRYDQNLDLIDERSFSGVHLLRNFSYNEPHLAYSVMGNEDYLVTIKNLDEEQQNNTYFHKRIISLGKKPKSYNSSIVGISKNGNVGVLSQNMPILFIYENVQEGDLSRPIKIIRFHDDDLDVLGEPTRFSESFGGNVITNPPPVELETGGRTVGVTPLFQTMHFGDEYIIIRQVKGDQLLVLERDGDSFTHKGSYQFLTDDDELFSYSSVYLEDSMLYLGTRMKDNVLIADINDL
jgi:hypothetical protein